MKAIDKKIDLLVAQYLETRGYKSTLEAFKDEAHYDLNAHLENQETLEGIVLDHEKFLKSQPVFNTDTLSEPLDPKLKFTISSTLLDDKPKSLVTPFDTAGLITSVVYVGRDSQLYKNEVDLVLVSGADKSLRMYDAGKQTLLHVFHGVHGSGAAIRAITYIGHGIVITGGMDGRFVATDLVSKETIGSERAHSRFINGIAYNAAHGILASAGFDGFIKLYNLKIVEGVHRQVIFTLLGTHKFLQMPTTVALVELGQPKQLVLLACTQDSTIMHFLAIPDNLGNAPVDSLTELRKVNLLDAEYSSFITFTPMHISVAPDGSGRYAVATSHAPYLRIILGNLNEDSIQQNILAHAPQDKFSTPRIKWSSDGKGIWTTGDDGVVRGIEVASGNLVAELKGGHDNKIRDIDICEVDGKDVIVTGGADKRVLLWGK